LIIDKVFLIDPFGSNADENILLKRKVELDTECLLKKRRVTKYKSNGSVINPTKRILNTDDILDPLKRMKMTYSSTGAQKTDTSSHVSNLAIVM
jgi:hypothetical protein